MPLSYVVTQRACESISCDRIAGNAAFILGTLAETEAGKRRVISLTESRHVEKTRILPDLVTLLGSTDSESVMNAAGTIGTLAESEEVCDSSSSGGSSS